MKIFWLLLIFLFTLQTRSVAQQKLLDIEDIVNLQQIERKPVLVLVGTSWCRYCQAMKNAIAKGKTDQVVLKKFYIVYLDAESKKDLEFNGRKYPFLPNGPNTGIQSLALVLGAVDGNLAYPTLSILSPDNEVVFRHQGYLNSRALASLLKKAGGY